MTAALPSFGNSDVQISGFGGVAHKAIFSRYAVKLEFIVMLISASPIHRICVICLLSIVVIAACGEQPAYRNVSVTEQTPSAEMFDALLTDDNILSATGMARQPELKYMESTARWRWSNPITVVEAKQNFTGPITHTIAEYSSAESARSVWWSRRDDKLDDTVANAVTETVDLLPREGRPLLASDDTRWRCERYYDKATWTYCVAQMRYRNFYVEVIGPVGLMNPSPQQFFELVNLADQRMRVFVDVNQ